MAILNPADLTWNGKEVMGISEAIFEKVFLKPGLNQFHTIVSGIKAKQQIALLGRLGLMGKAATGCSPTASSNTITSSEKFWDPVSVFDRLEECWTNIEATFFVWAKKNGLQASDLTDTDFANFLEDRISDAMIEAVLRIVWFNDTDAATVDESPAGVLTSGTTVGYFNIIDGLWKQIYAIVAADAARKVTITKNSGGTYALQAFDSTDTTNKVAVGIFQDLKYNADFRLRDQSDLVIIATQSLVDQYAKELRNYTNIDASFERIEGGYTQLMFEGIPIIGFNFWDRTIRSYMDDGAAYYQPHRAVLTTKSNLQIGSEEESALGNFESNYDAYKKLYFVDSLFKIDAKVIEDYMVQVAY